MNFSDLLEQYLQQRKNELVGGAEAIGTLGSGMVAQPIAGLAGIATGGNADTVRKVQEAMTYQPRTKAGRESVQGIGDLFAPIEKARSYLGDKTFEGTGSPMLAAGASVVPDAIMSLIPFAKPGALARAGEMTASGTRKAQAGVMRLGSDGKPVPQVSRKRVETTGQYVGAPPGIDSPQAYGNLVKSELAAVEEGAAGRDFYDNSSKYIWDVTGHRPEIANPFAQGTAVMSANTGVDTNLGFSIKAHNQAMAGDPIWAGRFPDRMSADVAKAYDPKAELFAGYKRDPFAQQLSTEWSPPPPGGFRGVNDIHEARRLGYDKDTPGEAQHAFMDNLRDRVTELANERKVAGFDDWQTGRTQAATWLKSRKDQGLVKPGEEAMDYTTFAPKYEARQTYETVPGSSSDHLHGVQDAPFDVKQHLHDLVSDAVTTPGGGDAFINAIGGLSPKTEHGALGIWGDQRNPMSSAKMLAGRQNANYSVLRDGKMVPDKKGKPTQASDETFIDDSSAKLNDASSALRAAMLQQEGAAWTAPMRGASTNKATLNSGWGIIKNSPFSPTDMQAIERMRGVIGRVAGDYAGDVGLQPTPSGVVIANYGNMPAAQFSPMLREIVKQTGKEYGFKPDAELAQKSSNYFANDFSKDPGARSYLEVAQNAMRDNPANLERAGELLKPTASNLRGAFAQFEKDTGFKVGKHADTLLKAIEIGGMKGWRDLALKAGVPVAVVKGLGDYFGGSQPGGGGQDGGPL